ncbi:predicted protein [Arabidopsis lyrata subsp. lyrata]|uniref:Predicted protein n=1 Tax=Arabidopsis lyrata subsp. lyrata TaxID=81972 RepID=D7MTK1_ARALL|nr:predicted protein [Arabidopsis lyrata subsp. lyrata]
MAQVQNSPTREMSETKQKARTLLMDDCTVAGALDPVNPRYPASRQPRQIEEHNGKGPNSNHVLSPPTHQIRHLSPEKLATATTASTESDPDLAIRPIDLSPSLHFQISPIRPSKNASTGPVNTKHGESRGWWLTQTSEDELRVSQANPEELPLTTASKPRNPPYRHQLPP